MLTPPISPLPPKREKEQINDFLCHQSGGYLARDERGGEAEENFPFCQAGSKILAWGVNHEEEESLLASSKL